MGHTKTSDVPSTASVMRSLLRAERGLLERCSSGVRSVEDGGPHPTLGAGWRKLGLQSLSLKLAQLQPYGCRFIFHTAVSFFSPLW